MLVDDKKAQIHVMMVVAVDPLVQQPVRFSHKIFCSVQFTLQYGTTNRTLATPRTFSFLRKNG